MPRVTNKLTDTALRTLKPGKRAVKHFDGGGLYLLLTPEGGKYWRLKYRYAGKELLLAIGTYPEVKLAAARKSRTEAREHLKGGRNPAAVKREEARQQTVAAKNTFEAVAREWHEQQRHKWTAKHGDQVLTSLEQNIFPVLGRRPVAEIAPVELLDVLRDMQSRGAIELATRVLQRCGSVFRYAITTSRAQLNPAADLRGALKAPPKGRFAALTLQDVPIFLDCLDRFPGTKQSELATRLLLLTFVRTWELRAACWEEFDFKAKLWRVPAERMKMRIEHLVPLSRQALKVLQEQRDISGHCVLVFPGRENPRRPMSENTILAGIKRMGFKGRTTGHGFRTLASTVLNEMGYAPDAIERQLAHGERNTVRAAYNKAQYLEQRTALMQSWADWLDSTRAEPSQVVVPMRKSRRRGG